MGKFSEKLIRVLATMLVCVMMSGMGVSAMAASNSTIDFTRKGSLTITPMYDNAIVPGGEFEIYKVADLSNDSNLNYNLKTEFASSGVDINKVKSAQELVAVAKQLSAVTGSVPPADVIALDRAKDGNTINHLELGVYLVIQTSAPAHYIAASPFLVYIPLTNDEGTSWVYDMMASPKMDYVAPVSVSVKKIWAGDTQDTRPTSVSVTLYQDGNPYDVITLSAQNNWKHEWNGLDGSCDWTVKETVIPEGYYAKIEAVEHGFEITNTAKAVVVPPPVEVGPAPQTGMVQWPIPVLALAGLLFIAIGLFAGRKKNRHG